MNILYLAHRIPYPPNKGDKIRSFRQLSHLALHHDVWCACFVDDPADRAYAEVIAQWCRDSVALPFQRRRALWRGVRGITAGGTFTESFYEDPRMRRTLREWSDTVSFDAVVAFSSSMAPYALAVPAKRRVLDLCDLDSRKWLDYAARYTPLRPAYALEGRRLARRERAWLSAFDNVLLISDAEAAPIREFDDNATIVTLGNGVELPPQRERAFTSGSPTGREDGGVVGFLGVMNYRPNVDAVCWFARRCWPAIRARCPGTVFRIVGRSPAPPVRRLASVPGVAVVGEVDDAAEAVRDFDVSVAPMRIARGVQNKVLEAMAAAKPVVLTREAAEGLDARDREAWIVENDPRRMSTEVVRLLRNPRERARLGRNAREHVAAHHRWKPIQQRFEMVVTGSVRRRAHEGTVERIELPPRPASAESSPRTRSTP